jgi:hypothetical protein
LLSASVLEEEFLGDILVSILGSKINNFQWLLAVKSRSFASCFEGNFKIHTVVDDDVKRIGELLNLVSVTDNLNLTFITRLENSVSLDDLPDTFFLLGESCIFGWDLGVVSDFECFSDILENVNILIIKNLLISINCWSGRHGQNRKHWWNLMSFDLHEKWNSNIL